MKSTVDSTVFVQSPWSPYTRWAFPYQLQFFGEVKYPQSNVPGASGAHTQFKSLGGQRYVDDILEPMPCTLISDSDFPTRWHLQSSGCQNFDMWAT